MNQSAMKAARADMRAGGMKSNHPRLAPDGRYKVSKRAKRFFSALSQEEKAKLTAKWKHLPRASWSQTLAKNIQAARVFA